MSSERIPIHDGPAQKNIDNITFAVGGNGTLRNFEEVAWMLDDTFTDQKPSCQFFIVSWGAHNHGD